MTRTFQTVDVFGQGDFSGNPVAVIFAADDLSTEEMQRITRWLNLSETTFLLPPTHDEADYRVRIFTLERELPFAGHPTLGSCHSWLAMGGTPKRSDRIVQECGAGLVDVRRKEARLAFAAPPVVRDGPVDESVLAEMLDVLLLDRSDVVEARWADNGPGWIGLRLASAEKVLSLEPARHHRRRVFIGVIGPYASGSETAFELRTFFSDQHGGIVEDPVTGSFQASAAQWMLATGQAKAPYLASQGTRLGRSGRVRIAQDDDGTVWIGGRNETLFSGDTSF